MSAHNRVPASSRELTAPRGHGKEVERRGNDAREAKKGGGEDGACHTCKALKHLFLHGRLGAKACATWGQRGAQEPSTAAEAGLGWRSDADGSCSSIFSRRRLPFIVAWMFACVQACASLVILCNVVSDLGKNMLQGGRGGSWVNVWPLQPLCHPRPHNPPVTEQLS